jgi:uncharacterized protein YllA (UPF0747 family)
MEVDDHKHMGAIHVIEKMHVDSLEGASRLFLDSIRDPQAGLEPFLPGIPPRDGRWVGENDARAAHGEEAWSAVLEDVESQSSRSGTSNEVLQKIATAPLFVITGQQPGVLGGPLHTIYKVVTAVALAERIERMEGRPCVPLYWCGADDTDFPEIRDLNLLNTDTIPFAASIPQDAYRGGAPVGGIGIEWVDRVWKSVRRFVSDFGGGGFVDEVIVRAFDRAHDHGELSSAILTGLVEGRIGIVDGRTESIRRLAQPLLVDFIENEDDVKREVAEGGARLERSGYHAQLTVGADSGVFLVEDGLRKAVTPELKARLLAAARQNPEACSPGVVARSLMQDFVFKPAAVVLGPAEIAYRAQIRSLYERFDVGTPVCVPRMTGVFLPPALTRFLDGDSGVSVGEMIGDPAGFARSVYRQSLPRELADAADRFRSEVMDVIDAFARTIDVSGDHRTTGRIKGRLSDLRKRSAQASDAVIEMGRRASIERWPFLAELTDVVKPGGKPQERTLSGLIPYLYAGASAVDAVRNVAGGYVDDLLDGRASHIVYSSTL